MLTSIGKILPLKVRQLGMEEELRFKKIKDGWNEIIKDSLGEKFENKSKPLKLKNKFLTVRCKSSVWSNEFQIKEDLVLKAVKKKFRSLVLERIKFMV